MPKINAANLAQHRELRRNQLIDAAMELAMVGGAKAVTVSAVAEKAGLSRSVIYEYFSSSADLIVDLVMEELENYARALANGVASAAANPTDQIASWISEALSYVADGRHLLAKSLSSAVSKDFRDQEIAVAHRNLIATVTGPLQELGVSDLRLALSYLQGIIDVATARIESGNDAAHETQAAIKFALAGFRALV
jgi:AcrR family transcriptional regulator